MRKVTMVRLGIASAITALGVSGAMASGCTSSSNTGGGDAGSDGSSSSGSSSGTSSSSGSSSGAPPAPANLIVAHAAPGLGPFRFCFATASAGATASVEPFTALPDGPGKPAGFAIPPQPIANSDGGYDTVAFGTPGIYPGTIAAMPTFGTSVQALTVTPYIIDSSQITGEVNFDGGAGLAPDGGAEDTCTALIGGHGKGTGDTPAGLLTPGVQYWQLPDIASGSLQDTKTYILALTGCLPGFQLTATELTLAGAATEEGHAVSPTPASVCGASFDGGSNNLAISVSQLDTTTVIGGGSDAGIGIQFANVSTALQGNPFLFPIESGGTLLEVIVHPPASDGLLPGIPGESVIVTDGGELEDGAANPITNIIPTFNPIAATPSTVATSGTLPAAVEVSGLPILNSDGGAGPVAFAAATLPGTDDGGISPLPYPVYVVGSTPTLGDLFEIPFSDIFALSAWSASTPAGGTPAYFLPGQTYTFVVMGSNDVGIPQLVNPDGTPNTTTYDGRGLHIVAFPNTFTPSQAP